MRNVFWYWIKINRISGRDGSKFTTSAGYKQNDLDSFDLASDRVAEVYKGTLKQIMSLAHLRDMSGISYEWKLERYQEIFNEMERIK